MLRRQRTTLAVLTAAQQPLPSTELFKLMFLLGQETFIGRDNTFYEFVPYRYGPFSFALNRELEALTAYGYARAEQSGPTTSYAITDPGAKEAKLADSDTMRATKVIVSKYGKRGLRVLLKDVYARYPWYSTRSELKDLIPPNAPVLPVAQPAIYTIGYEGRSVDGFLDDLLRVGIRLILDVRANPVSRKYGFASTALRRITEKLEIGYEHWPALGIPSEKRHGVESSEDFRQLFIYYQRELLPKRAAEIRKVAERIATTPAALLCMEKDPRDCHRSRLAAVLAETSKLSIVHL